MWHRYKAEVIDPGDGASRLAKDVCYGSHKNCSAVIVVPHQPGNFRGHVGFIWREHVVKEMLQNKIDKNGNATAWTMLQEVENDGAGGKPQFFTFMGTADVFRGLGWEIITMTADDLARSGRFPAIIDNEINVKRITDRNFPLFQAMIEGYGDALAQAGLVNITGGGAFGKLGDLLPPGVGANLHNMPEAADVLLLGQELSMGTQYRSPRVQYVSWWLWYVACC